MHIHEENLLLLHYCCSGNYDTIKKFFVYDPTFSTIHTLTSKEIHEKLQIQYGKAKRIAELLKMIKVEHLLQAIKRKKICYTTIFRDDYPPLLKTIFDPPWVLYYVGNPSLLTYVPALSVVGTRHPSDLARRELRTILSNELCNKIMIVSGLALGIDALAHEIAIERNGNTIAVLAYGFDYVYPKTNEKLYHRLKETQLIITEYPPYVRPQRWQFPERNRIISGISQATFVVEAKEKSGSLITSELALQQGRDVFALPGRISHETSKGTNLLIQDGAKPILSPSDIIDEYFPFNK